jgi:hypothetical protein
MLFVEHLWGHHHRNREIGPELIIGPFSPFSRSEDVLVNTSAVDKTRINCIFCVIRGIYATLSAVVDSNVKMLLLRGM